MVRDFFCYSCTCEPRLENSKGEKNLNDFLFSRNKRVRQVATLNPTVRLETEKGRLRPDKENQGLAKVYFIFGSRISLKKSEYLDGFLYSLNMNKNKFTFKGRGDREINDVIYDRLFDITTHSYTFLVHPKVRYWRFGMRLSKTTNIEFYEDARHENSELKDIHIAVGDIPGIGLSNSPNKLELGQYHIEGYENILKRCETYVEQTEVELKLNYDLEKSTLNISCYAGGCISSEIALSISKYKYFKIFAWADWMDFEIDCDITEVPLIVKKSIRLSVVVKELNIGIDHIVNFLEDQGIKIERKPTSKISAEVYELLQKEFQDVKYFKTVSEEISKQRIAKDNSYWLLKLDNQTYEIASFYSGLESWVGAKYLEKEGLKLFNSINKGDIIVGYDFKGNNFVCVFEVAGLVHDVGKGDILNLIITIVFDPAIPLNLIKNNIPFFNEIENSNNLLISITKEIYNAIIIIRYPKSEIYFYPSYTTEGSHETTEDQLEFEYDIESIASVISLKEVKPPLAVGLFGKWGSGKSFFMEKLSDKIDEYSRSGTDGFIKNVVQVKFNSWHYSDANLWASLITEIFDSLASFSNSKNKKNELKKLSETLQITSIQKEAVELKRKELKEKIDSLEKERKAKRNTLEVISGIKLLKLFFGDKKIRESFAELNNSNIENIVLDKHKLENYLEEIKAWKSKLEYYFREFKNLKGNRWIVMMILALVVFGVTFLLQKYFMKQWETFSLNISIASSIIISTITKLLAALKPAMKTWNETTEKLNHLKKTIEARESKIPIELTEGEKELNELTNSIEEIDRKIEDTNKQIHDILSGKKLLEFIEKRSRDENYSRQLGLISWIRKDFKVLDELLRKQHELSETEKKKLFNPQDVQLQIDRIILYIDDLDRCKEETVVKVLEAIHLLLAFPLFVVVVGVDPRWLDNALNEKYKVLFGNYKSNRDSDIKMTDSDIFNTGVATTYDYLEKIFQIPFNLKSIDKPGRENLITYIIRNEMEEIAPKEKQSVITKTTENTSSIISENIPIVSDVNEPTKNINKNIGSDQGISSGNENKNLNTQKKEREKIKKVKLKFSTGELEFMKKVSPLFGHTPRGINRFLNIYRIIKSHGTLKVKDDFSEQDFIPIMFLLSIIVGYSVFSESFIKNLFLSKKNISMHDFLKEPFIPPDLKKAIIKHVDKKVLRMPLELFKNNLELISRFSFRTLI